MFDTDTYLNQALDVAASRWRYHPDQNVAALRDYLRGMAGTAIAEDFGFHHIDPTLSDAALENAFRDRLPLTSYETFQPYVARILAGEPSILGQGVPKALTVSGGTLGVAGRKLVPLYSDLRSNQSVATYVVALYRGMARRGAPYLNLVKPVNLSAVERAPGGLPIAMASTFVEGAFGPAAAFSDRYEGVPHALKTELHANRRGRWLVQALAALGHRDLRYVFSIYPNVIISFFQWIEEAWPLIERMLLERSASTLAELGLTPSTVAMVEQTLLARIDEDRRAEIVDAGRLPLRDRIPMLWPEFTFAVSVVTGGYVQYRAVLRECFGLETHTLSYGASEGALGTNLFDAEPLFVPNARTYFEFMDLEAASGDAALPVSFAGARSGRLYELVVTSPQSGFFRYGIGDVVRLVDGPRGPRFEIVGRASSHLSIAHEMTREGHVVRVLSRFIEDRPDAGIGLGFVGADFQALRYVFFLETATAAHRVSPPAEAAEALDHALARENDLYGFYRREGGLRPPVVHVVPAGTAQAWVDARASEEDSRDLNQVKPSIILSGGGLDHFILAAGK